MTVAATEQASDRYRDLDAWSTPVVLDAIVTAQQDALAAVAAAVPAITAAAEAICAKVRAGGRLVYAGAGSSGLLAHLDAGELPGTYGITEDRVPVLLAGGGAAIDQSAEDDVEGARSAVDGLGIGPADAVLALAASGGTPFTVAALERAKARGALTIGLACAPGTALLAAADHPLLIETPAEVIAGSTRMNAGTAQKCVLNMISTLLGLRLGHGYGGMMVNLRADNAKLRQRAVAIVARAAGVPESEAAAALERAGSIKTAILLCAGVPKLADAEAMLAAQDGDLRPVLAGLVTLEIAR